MEVAAMSDKSRKMSRFLTTLAITVSEIFTLRNPYSFILYNETNPVKIFRFTKFDMRFVVGMPTAAFAKAKLEQTN